MTCPDACILAPGHDGRHIDCRAAPIIVASEAAPVVTTKPRRKYDRRHLCRTADHDCTFQGETCIDCGKCVPMPILPPSAVQESRIMSPGGDEMPSRRP